MKNVIVKIAGVLFLLIFLIPQSIEAINSDHRRKRHRKRHKVVKVNVFFNQFDHNHNHRLCRREVVGDVKIHFNKIDRNQDGYISKRELRRAPKSFRYRR